MAPPRAPELREQRKTYREDGHFQPEAAGNDLTADIATPPNVTIAP
jgi:hypothetical protein